MLQGGILNIISEKNIGRISKGVHEALHKRGGYVQTQSGIYLKKWGIWLRGTGVPLR